MERSVEVVVDVLQHNVDLKEPQVNRIANDGKLDLQACDEELFPIHDKHEGDLYKVHFGITREFQQSDDI